MLWGGECWTMVFLIQCNDKVNKNIGDWRKMLECDGCCWRWFIPKEMIFFRIITAYFPSNAQMRAYNNARF